MAYGTIEAPEQDIPTPDAAEAARKMQERAEQDGKLQQELNALATRYATDVEAVLKKADEAAREGQPGAKEAMAA